MNGIINVLKPVGITSHDVINFFRKVLEVEKAGHTGTLDPGASGVLPVCMGKATKISEYVMQGRKRYRAGIAFGITTDTMDSYGKVISRTEANFSEAQLKEAVESFKGIIMQVPPIYSAIKVNGQKLYNLARKGENIKLEPRKVEIYKIEILSINIPDEVIVDIECSKGTYIRSLCHDIGEKIGCGAHMSSLIRTGTGKFDIESAYTLEKLEEMKREGKLHEAVLPMDYALNELKEIVLKDEDLKRFLNGFYIEARDLEDGGTYRIYNNDRELIALGKTICKNNNMRLKIDKMLI